MSRQGINDGEFGFKLRFVTGADATGHETAYVLLVPPTGPTVTRTLTYDDETDGLPWFIVQDGDFGNGGKGGTWFYQVVVDWGVTVTKRLKSKMIPLEVGASAS